jgi:Lon protease-like protein
MTTSLPIFALGTVLFPGGVLPLRVFEARYVDMIRGVMREGGTFGVNLIRRGAEVGKGEIDVEPVGCHARIEHWNMEQLGVLEIVAIGTERFEIVTSRVAKDGLLVAEVAPLAPEAPLERRDDVALCWSILQRVVTGLETDGGDSDDRQASPPPIAKPYRMDDATWVGNRLAELLPLPMPMRQQLMALTDAHARLVALKDFLALHGVG